MLCTKLQIILLTLDTSGIAAAMEVEDDIIYSGACRFLVSHGMDDRTGIDHTFALIGLCIGFRFCPAI